MNFLNSSKTADISFSMGFVVEPYSSNSDRTLLARSNNASGVHVFEVTETATRTLRVKLFTDSENYLTFESAQNSIPTEAHSIIFSYSAITKNITTYIDGKLVAMTKEEHGTYTHMNPSPSILYTFKCTPIPSVWADTTPITAETKLYDKNGNLIPDSNPEYVKKDETVYINNKPCIHAQTGDIKTDILYAWFFDDGSVQEENWKLIYTKKLNIDNAFVPLYNRDGTLYTGSLYSVVQSGNEFIVAYKNEPMEYKESKNVPTTTLYCYQAASLDPQLIWANSSANPTILFYNDGGTYTGNDWYIEGNKVYYKGEMAEPLEDVVEAPLNTTSYITGENGSPEKLINSNVGLIFVLKEALSQEKMRAVSLNISATMGKNPCISSYL